MDKVLHRQTLVLACTYQTLLVWHQKIASASTLVEFSTTTFGFGMTSNIGVGGGFMTLDMNIAGNDVPQLSRSTRSFVFGHRFGKALNLNNDKSNIAV